MTPLKSTSSISGPEAVTTRGSIGFVILALLLATSGSALATAPVPKFEYWAEVPDVDRTAVVQKVDEKELIRERCLPRDLLCVGPYTLELEDDTYAGNGARVYTNDTWTMAGHNTGRYAYYGPFVFPTNENDLHVCHTPCKLPDPFYAAAHANVTVELYTYGDTRTYSFDVNRSISSVHLGIIPRSWCEYAQQTTC